MFLRLFLAHPSNLTNRSSSLSISPVLPTQSCVRRRAAAPPHSTDRTTDRSSPIAHTRPLDRFRYPSPYPPIPILTCLPAPVAESPTENAFISASDPSARWRRSTCTLGFKDDSSDDDDMDRPHSKFPDLLDCMCKIYREVEEATNLPTAFSTPQYILHMQSVFADG